MYQINYNGLRRRDLYDEIVAILENDPTILKYPDRVPKSRKRGYPVIRDEFNAKIKYPDRVATQILNSPYMKQIDGETLLEVQKQQERLSKESLKKMMIQAIADATGLPNKHLTAVADKAKKAEIVDKVTPELFHMARGDTETEDFRSAIGEDLLERSRIEMEKRDSMAQAVAETLSQGAGTPLHHEAVGVQAKHDVANKSTEVTLYRKEEQQQYSLDDLLQQLEVIENYKKYERQIKQLQRTFREREKAKGDKASSSSGLGNVAKDLGGLFSSVASGLGSVFNPYAETPRKGKGVSSGEEPRTPPQGSKSRDGADISSIKQIKSEVKSEVKSVMGSGRGSGRGSGMALPVTPGDGRSPSVKKSEASVMGSGRGSGMALPVTPGDGRSPPTRISTPSALRSKGKGTSSSKKSFYIGSPEAASLSTPPQSAQTIHSSPAQTSGGLRLKKDGTPDKRYSQNWIPKSKS